MNKRYYYDGLGEDIYDSEIDDYPSNLTICETLNKQDHKIAVLERALKLASEHIAIKQCFDCPLYNECIDNDACDIQISNYFKSKAESDIKNDKE